MQGQTGVLELLEPLKRVQEQVRDAVVAACERAALEDLARVADDTSEGDTIYAVDRISEDSLVQMFEAEIATVVPVVLAGEGLPGGQVVLPRGAAEPDAVWRVIVDPIDGTRGLMYQKRSGWILTGIAPHREPQGTLRDIVLAVQTEIPLLKQHLSDQVWALRGHGAEARRVDRLSGAVERVTLRPSRADTIAHGFATICRFFPGARDVLAAIDDEVAREAIGPPRAGQAACFEDQYLSTG